MTEKQQESEPIVELPLPNKDKDKRIIIRLSSHIADRYEICPRYFNFTTNEGWALAEEAKYFTTGRFVHKMLARYYSCIKEGMDLISARDDAVMLTESKYASEFDLSFEEIQFYLKHFKDYVGHYAEDKWINKVLEVEKLFSRIIYEDEEIVILYEGTPDLIFENHEGVTEVMDHKKETAKRVTFGLNNQFLAYPFLLGITRIYRNAIGVQKTKSPSERFHREMFNFPQGAIDEWKDNMVKIGKRIIQSYKDNQWEAHYSQCETNQIHRNGCMFQEVCRMAKVNWNYELETEFVKTSGIYY